MPKKHYEVGIAKHDFEDLIAGQRKPLPRGSLLEAIWLLTKYSEKDRGYTAKELADYFKVPETMLRSAISGLNKRGYFVTFVCEVSKDKKKVTAGVLRDVFASDNAWETAWGRRLRNYLLPQMERMAHLGELTAYARPHLLPRIAEFVNEANNEWLDTRKRLAKSVKALK